MASSHYNREHTSRLGDESGRPIVCTFDYTFHSVGLHPLHERSDIDMNGAGLQRPRPHCLAFCKSVNHESAVIDGLAAQTESREKESDAHNRMTLWSCIFSVYKYTEIPKEGRGS